MKRAMIALAVSAITLGTTITTDVEACTRIARETKDHGVFVSAPLTGWKAYNPLWKSKRPDKTTWEQNMAKK